MRTHEQKGIIMYYTIIYLYIPVIISFCFPTDHGADISSYYTINLEKDIF